MYINFICIKHLMGREIFSYDVGRKHTCLSCRIPRIESQYGNHLYFYTIYCISLFKISGTGKHTLFTQTKRESIYPYGYINSLKHPPIYPIHNYHSRHPIDIASFHMLHLYWPPCDWNNSVSWELSGSVEQIIGFQN